MLKAMSLTCCWERLKQSSKIDQFAWLKFTPNFFNVLPMIFFSTFSLGVEEGNALCRDVDMIKLHDGDFIFVPLETL